jgi:endoglucanase
MFILFLSASAIKTEKNMKYFITLFVIFTLTAKAESWIRINQLGYLNHSIKVAVLISKEQIDINSFEIFDAESNESILQLKKVKSFGEYPSFKTSFRLDFSELTKEGKYYLKAGEIISPTFRIGNDVYNGTADYLLKYMRQQRCGYNPFLQDSCHTQDGFIVDHPTRTNEYIDVKGGWHDATDYLQYLTTSANAVYQLLFAYMQNPESYKDEFDENGNPGANNIPDILDEAKWGLDWLVKMNPKYGEMFNQIADDRDHAGFRLPNHDSVDYGKEFERPVYFVTGKVQGLSKHKNRSTGVSSSAAKYASSFALGSDLLKKYYPKFSELIKQKAVEAYEFAKSDLGVNQTASYKSPYFYEEDNYVDDLELAAIQLYKTFGEEKYLTEAAAWGTVEPFTPWMGADTARHYQWYPFINLGHYYLSKEKDEKISKSFLNFYRKGLDNIYQRGKDNAFNIGIPFIWCSNNLVAAAITQAHLYHEVSGDDTFAEMEAALRDWLFGCNPWGTSMIVGLPEDGDSPSDPHSSLWVVKKYQTYGGLVDGPIYGSIFKILIGLQLTRDDTYAPFQSDKHVYHDDYGDYSTNEPTMDGTASLSYYLSKMEAIGKSIPTDKNE